jgi:hypothetical protein
MRACACGADERTADLAFEAEIADELSFADEKAQILAATHRRANTFGMHRDQLVGASIGARPFYDPACPGQHARRWREAC